MKKTKLISILMVLILTISSMSIMACSKPGSGQGGGTDETKTLLSIGNRDRGFGHDWIDEVAKEFELAYADYVGENGKIGVEVEITNKVSEFATKNLEQNMPYNGYDLYILDELDYMTLYNAQYNGASVLADITDVVTANNYDDSGSVVSEGGTNSISGKIIEDYRNYYNLGSEQAPKFYGLPFAATPGGGVYDADVFDKYALYYKADGTIGAKQRDIDNGTCGKGPDGELGTYDDGMPATWEEFKDLLYYMSYVKSVTPFIWCGTNTYQREYFTTSIIANYEGYNNFNLLFTLEGEHTKKGKIDNSNAWQLGQTEGRAAAVRAYYDIMSDGKYYSEKSMATTTTHTMAQMLYVKSIQQGTPIAMFMEGSYWEEEARDYFEEMGRTNPKWGFGKRNFKLLPVPNFKGSEINGFISDQEDNRQVLVMQNSAHSSIVLSAQAQQLDLAKEFLKFMHSREMLVRTTQVGSFIRPFEYTFTPAEKDGCTSFTKNIIEVMEDKNTDIAWACHKRGGKVEMNATYFKYWETFEPASLIYSGGGTASISSIVSNFNKFNKDNWVK